MVLHYEYNYECHQIYWVLITGTSRIHDWDMWAQVVEVDALVTTSENFCSHSRCCCEYERYQVGVDRALQPPHPLITRHYDDVVAYPSYYLDEVTVANPMLDIDEYCIMVLITGLIMG